MELAENHEKQLTEIFNRIKRIEHERAEEERSLGQADPIGATVAVSCVPAPVAIDPSAYTSPTATEKSVETALKGTKKGLRRLS